MINWLRSLLMGGLALTSPGGTASLTQQTFGSPLPASSFVSKATVKWIDDVRQKYDIPGLGIGLISSPNRDDDDWKTEFLAFGHKDLEYSPYEMDTTFHIADNSKLFVALSVGLLIHNETLLASGEKLGYHTKIKDILPEWSLIDKYAQDHVDVLDILSMRSGIPQHFQSYGLQDAAEHVRQLGHLRPSTEIRQKFQYNDHHYWVMAEVVRHLTSLTIVEYATEHILQPLGLSASTVNHTAAAESGDLAGAYLRKGLKTRTCQDEWNKHNKVDRSCFGGPVPVEWFVEGDGSKAPGPLVSSFHDMLKLVKELLDPKVIPKQVVTDTHQRVIVAFGDMVPFDERGTPTYGLAQVTYNYRGHELIQHVGVLPGAGSTILRVPALGIGIVLAINDIIVGAPLIDPIIYRLLDDIFGLEPIDWEQRLVPHYLTKMPPSTTPPGHPRPAPGAEDVIGVYSDRAYGSLNITRFDEVNFEISTHDLLSAYNDVRPEQPKPDYVALMSNIYSRGLILTHFDGPLYNATHIVSRKEVGGKAFPILPHFHTAVIAEGGIGLFDNFWMAEGGKRAVEDNVERAAEVWFAKVRN